MSDTGEVEAAVRNAIADLIEADVDFPATDALVAHGVDSLMAVELTLRLEDRFELVFDDEDIRMENFQTIREIVRLLAGKLAVS